MFEAGAEIGEHAHTRARRRKDFGIEAVGDRRADRVVARHRFEESAAIEMLVRFVKCDVEMRAEMLFDSGGPFAGDE